MGSCPGTQALGSWVSRLVNRQSVHMPSVITYICDCMCLGEGRGERRREGRLGLEICMPYTYTCYSTCAYIHAHYMHIVISLPRRPCRLTKIRVLFSFNAMNWMVPEIPLALKDTTAVWPVKHEKRSQTVSLCHSLLTMGKQTIQANTAKTQRCKHWLKMIRALTCRDLALYTLQKHFNHIFQLHQCDQGKLPSMFSWKFIEWLLL